MPFATLRKEKTLADLVESQYGKLKAADAAKAEERLAAANPQLRDAAAFTRGAVIEVPRLHFARLAAATSATDPLRIAAEVLTESAKAWATTFETGIAAERASLKADKNAISSKQARAVLADSPSLEPVAAGVEDGIKEREVRLRNSEALLRTLPKILDAFKKQAR